MVLTIGGVQVVCLLGGLIEFGCMGGLMVSG